MKFKSLVVDPPWRYRNTNTGGSMKSGADNKYGTLSLQDLCKLPVKEVADDNAVLFLWVTTPLKYEIAQSGLVEKWGFSYVTTIYWRKINKLGLGFNFRGAVEECWMCKRGKVKSWRTDHPNVIQSQPRKHSQKPEEFFEMIEPSINEYELTPRLEMFSRTKRPGWVAIGSGVTGNDIRKDLRKMIKL